MLRIRARKGSWQLQVDAGEPAAPPSDSLPWSATPMIARPFFARGRSLREDADFDVLGSRFEEMYDSSWGHVRLEVLWEDLLASIPALQSGGARVLDAGGGSGRIAIRLAQLGNEVVLCDASREMLDRAAAEIDEAGLANHIAVVHARIQDLETNSDKLFDTITCHAVLEWLAQPKDVVAHLVELLEPGGHLSLMFTNRNAILLKRVLGGDFSGALADLDLPSKPTAGGHRPRLERPSRRGLRSRLWRRIPEPSPLDETTVRDWLGEAGCLVRSKAGVRIFHDHLSAAHRSPDRLADLVRVEKRLRSTEPFASLGQHVHLVSTRLAAA
jgi:tRNA 5-carboxymethoxyuridine methyltransferase